MRQKRIKGVDETLLSSRGVIVDVIKLTLPDTTIAIEIGSGKGDFITNLAKDYPHTHFIALEKNKYVCYRILEKKESMDLNNLTIVLGDAIDLETYLGEKQVDQIYLNFSDPWPKKRHHKRRLTANTFTPLYLKILDDQGTLQFRTDHEVFFDDSISYLEKTFELYDINRDLPVSLYMTEYEVKKRKIGPIYQLKGKKRHVTKAL